MVRKCVRRVARLPGCGSFEFGTKIACTLRVGTYAGSNYQPEEKKMMGAALLRGIQKDRGGEKG